MRSAGTSDTHCVPDDFLQLSQEDQAGIIQGSAPIFGLVPAVLEKDVWVCWTLARLFEMPDRLPMAFKGGTSLSKAFDAIRRFSEDVDVTLDYRGFGLGFDPFAEKKSNTQLKYFSKDLKARVGQHVRDVVSPYFQRILADQLAGKDCKIEIDGKGEKLRLYYPSVLDETPGYVGNSVLIEFGGRNIVEPNQPHTIRPYLAQVVLSINFPVADVIVLAPTRTFWEKATLIHVECNRKKTKADADRMSRHWYDLAMLADHDIGRLALADRALLADVVKHKKVFFRSPHANYDACLSGGLRLVPGAAMLAELRSDFEEMCTAGMFYGEPPLSFDRIIESLQSLETRING